MLPSELRALIVGYLPNNQVLANLADRLFDNHELDYLDLEADKAEYEYALDRDRNKMSTFNRLMSQFQIDGRANEVSHNGTANFRYQPGRQFISDSTLISILNAMGHSQLLWYNNQGQDEVISKFETIMDINKMLTQFGSHVRLVPIYLSDRNNVIAMRF